jgi:aspartate aminotransferase
VVSNGAKQSFANLSMSLLDEGDEVIVFSPYWVSYKEIIGLSGAKPVFIYAGVEQDYKVSPAQLAAAINERTRMIVFSSPCNPTGSVFSKAELQALAQVIHQAQNQEIVIVSDEIYEYINFTEEGHFSIAACPEIAARTVVINGFSKGYSMTGWRLGYIAAPLWIAEACVKMQGQFTSGASSFGQKAAAFALQAELPEIKTMNEAFRQRRDLMLDLFAAIPGFSFNRPEGAFYLFPDISPLIGKSFEGQVMKSAEDLAYFFLYQAHVALVSGEAFGAPNCIRFSYAASEEQLRMAAARIAKAVALLV